MKKILYAGIPYLGITGIPGLGIAGIPELGIAGIPELGIVQIFRLTISPRFYIIIVFFFMNGVEKKYQGFKTTLLNNPDAADLFDMVA